MTRHVWTPEDVAYAAAQWGSGISQREIASGYGYANASTVTTLIRSFLIEYAGMPAGDYEADYGNDRKRWIPLAVARFVAQRITAKELTE